MPPKENIWTIETELALVDLVCSRPILWNTSLADYRRTDLKEIQWEAIAKILDPQFSGELTVCLE